MSGPFIKSLTISHFRSHKLCRLSCRDGRPVAIHGPNGAGKTNILEAISLLSPGRGLRRASADNLARKPEALGWKISAALRDSGGDREVETWAEPGCSRNVRIDGKPSMQAGLGRVVRILWLEPSMDRMWNGSAEGRRRFLDRMTLSFEPGHAEAVLAYEKAMRQRNRLLKDRAHDAHWYRVLENRMAETGAEIAANRRGAVSMLSAGQNATARFPAARLEIAGPDGVDFPEEVGALREALASSRSRDLAAGRSLVGPHRADLSAICVDRDIPARDCSTGEQKALLISLILANARVLKARIGAPPILLLDEIAAHLDSSRRAALYDEICALGAQAWMTGTGAELFAPLGARGSYLGVEEDDGASRAVEAPTPE